MQDKLAVDVVTDNYRDYGEYVNLTRSVTGVDGLKSVQRKTLFALRDVDSKSNIPSAEILARMIKCYYNHGNDSAYDTLCRLVRKGFIKSMSNFGLDSISEEIPAAAFRYTKVKSYPEVSEAIFRFLDYVPKFENDHGYLEPAYIPTPIPFALMTGAKGIGIGILNTVPAFSPTSLLDAYLNNDYRLLKAPPSYTLDSSQLKPIWQYGEGQINYSLNCYQTYSQLDEKNVSIIEGSGSLFRPNTESEFKNDLDQDFVYIRNGTYDITISRTKGLKRYTDEEIHERVKKIASQNLSFRIYVSERGQTRRRSVKEWLHRCYTMYDNIVVNYKTKEVESLEKKIRILNLIPQAYPHISKDIPLREISSILNCDFNELREVESKPLRMLRQSDFNKQISEIQKEIKHIKSITTENLAQNYVKIIENSQKELLKI